MVKINEVSIGNGQVYKIGEELTHFLELLDLNPYDVIGLEMSAGILTARIATLKDGVKQIDHLGQLKTHTVQRAWEF